MQKYIDAHCHLGNGAETQNTSVVGYVCNSVAQSDWGQMVDALQNNRIFPCLGIHPWHVADAGAGWADEMYRILVANPRIMIGEIGLDKLRPDFEAQQSVFIRQFEIATELQRPVHIHCVRAWNEIWPVLSRRHTPPVIVLHAFGGNAEIARKLCRYKNVYFSFSDTILDGRRTRLRDAIKTVPDDRILIESDGPIGMAECVLPQICSKIAEIKNIDNEKMADIIYANTRRILPDGQITQNTFTDWR